MNYTVKEAQELVLKESKSWGFEEVNLNDAFGRVLCENIYADRNYPPFNRSAVDGFAIRAEDLSNNSFKIIEEVYAGAVATNEVGKNTTIKVMTGAPVPHGADAVIKVEDAEVTGDSVSFTVSQVKSKANISIEGEDTLKGKIAIHKNQLCTAHVLGTLASLGQSKVKVHKHPKVAIISTGDEIKNVGEEILSYQIRDSNAYALSGFFKQYGIEQPYKTIVPDDKEKLKAAIEKVLDADIIILSGGVSMGDADFVPEVLQSLGVKKVFHKIAVKPGKPIWFGTTEKNVVFALPGNPFSVQVGFKLFIEPYLRNCMGLTPFQFLKLPLIGSKKKKTNFDEYFPCRIANSSALEIISFNGSGDITAALNSDGIALHPASKNEIIEGEYLDFIFWDSF